jgi:hypothetical protein
MGRMKIGGYAFNSLWQCSHACCVPFMIAHFKTPVCNGKYIVDFRAIFHARRERELESYIRQAQPYPYIFLSSGFSRTKCPLGDLSIFRHAMFPYEFPLPVRRIDLHAIVCRGSKTSFSNDLSGRTESLSQPCVKLSLHTAPNHLVIYNCKWLCFFHIFFLLIQK